MSIPHSFTWHKTGLYAWYALVFLQPFNPFGALRIIAAATLFICLLGELLHSRVVDGALASRIAIAVALWAIIASLLGPYPLDSAHALRKELLVQVLMLLSALVYLRNVSDVWRLVGVALGGFVTVSLLCCFEIGNSWANHGISLWIERGHDSFWGGYAATAAFYVPLLAGWLLAARRPWPWAVGGWLAVAVALLLITLYGSRTPLIAIAVATLALLTLLKRWRSLITAALLALCFMTVIQAVPPSHLDRYKSLLKSETYITNDGLSARLAVWEGCWEVIAERPLTGYGYGWKKLAWAITDGQFDKRWATRPDLASYYLSNGTASYGKVNPHNYVLQVMFEIGIIGLALVAAFWLATFREGAILLRHADPERRKLAASLLAVLIGYATANLSNGYWVGGLANLSLAFAGCIIVLARTSRA